MSEYTLGRMLVFLHISIEICFINKIKRKSFAVVDARFIDNFIMHLITYFYDKSSLFKDLIVIEFSLLLQGVHEFYCVSIK